MKLIVAKDYEEMSVLGAELVASLITACPHTNLGLTTGNTPVGLYEKLVKLYQSGSLSLDAIRVYCTEEYLGIGPQDSYGLFAWLHREFIAPCNLAPTQVFRLRGEDSEPQLACMEFEEQIFKGGGLDLIVESIGLNGHVGFNEPGSPINAPTRILALSDDTLEYNYNYWNASVPGYGLTIGLGTILAAKQILLLVSGRAKAEPLAKALIGPITPEVPASALQMAAQLTVVADREAAALLADEEVRSAG